MASYPDPAAGPTHPVACDPHRSWSGSNYPTSPHPDVVGSGPSPITGRPDISWPRCHRLGFDADWGRSSRHQNLTSWPRRCHFLCGRCRRYRGWLFCASDQCQWHKHQQVRVSVHLTPPIQIRFASNRRLYQKSKLHGLIAEDRF